MHVCLCASPCLCVRVVPAPMPRTIGQRRSAQVAGINVTETAKKLKLPIRSCVPLSKYMSPLDCCATHDFRASLYRLSLWSRHGCLRGCWIVVVHSFCALRVRPCGSWRGCTPFCHDLIVPAL